MSTKCQVVLSLVLAGCAATAWAQTPLAEVARKETERRKTVAAPARVFTNADVRPVPPPAPRPAAAVASPEAGEAAGQAAEAGNPAGGTAAGGAGAPVEAEDPRAQEAAWRKRITEARDQLRRSTIFREALQSRINGLTTDFVARDDPHQRAQVAKQRQDSIAELERVNRDIEAGTALVAQIEEEARRAGVPPGWLR
jgi:hypothetical protein